MVSLFDHNHHIILQLTPKQIRQVVLILDGHSCCRIKMMLMIKGAGLHHTAVQNPFQCS